MRCGSETCSGDRSACCGSPPGCKAPSACAGAARYRCAGSGDCLPGERCWLLASGTECSGERPNDHGYDFPDPPKLVCQTDADCRGHDAACTGGSCRPSATPGVMTCACAAAAR
jgi:hypothetical protein